MSHSVYNDVGFVKTHFSAHLPGSVFSLTRNLFSATKVRARTVLRPSENYFSVDDSSRQGKRLMWVLKPDNFTCRMMNIGRCGFGSIIYDLLSNAATNLCHFGSSPEGES